MFAWKLESIFLILPMFTRTGFRKQFWGRRLRGGATRFDLDQDYFRFGKGPNDVGSSRYHLIRGLRGELCGGWVRITSTFIICMGLTR